MTWNKALEISRSYGIPDTMARQMYEMVCLDFRDATNQETAFRRMCMREFTG